MPQPTTVRQALNDDALDAIFRTARTCNGWLDKPVTDGTLHRIYDLMKWGPTSANSSPARFLFLRTQAAKERLLPALAPANVQKTMSAPVTVIVGYDTRFYEKMPNLFPRNPGFRDLVCGQPGISGRDRKAEQYLAGRIPDRRRPRAGTRLRPHVGL